MTARVNTAIHVNHSHTCARARIMELVRWWTKIEQRDSIRSGWREALCWTGFKVNSKVPNRSPKKIARCYNIMRQVSAKSVFTAILEADDEMPQKSIDNGNMNWSVWFGNKGICDTVILPMIDFKYVSNWLLKQHISQMKIVNQLSIIICIIIAIRTKNIWILWNIFHMLHIKISFSSVLISKRKHSCSYNESFYFSKSFVNQRIVRLSNADVFLTHDGAS